MATRKGQAKHEAKATNWNGKRISTTFTASGELESLARKARAAFERDGYKTFRLDSIDGNELPYDLAY